MTELKSNIPSPYCITAHVVSKGHRDLNTDHPNCQRLSCVWQRPRRRGFQPHICNKDMKHRNNQTLSSSNGSNTWLEGGKSCSGMCYCNSATLESISKPSLLPIVALWEIVKLAPLALLFPSQTHLLLGQRPFYWALLHNYIFVSKCTPLSLIITCRQRLKLTLTAVTALSFWSVCCLLLPI